MVFRDTLQTVRATSGRRGLELALQKPPHIVIAGMRLEGMHGINFGIPFVQRSDDTEFMPNHISGSSYSFNQLLAAFTADSQADDDAHFLLYRGEEILALCLRFKYNPVPHEVWVGDDPVLAEWGRKLADLKGKKTVPVYYSQRGRRLYEVQRPPPDNWRYRRRA